jgi:hypothetical protein
MRLHPAQVFDLLQILAAINQAAQTTLAFGGKAVLILW